MLVDAAIATGPGRAFVLTELELDEPRAGEVRVRLAATGVCHTDTKVRDRMAPGAPPIVLGHEGAGVVEALGPGVTGLVVGDPVVLSFDHCGACRWCREGLPSYCETYEARNFGGARLDGTTAFRRGDESVGSHFFGQSAFATRTNAARASVIPAPADVPLELLAPLGCGVLTGAGAVLNALDSQPGSAFAVFGAGAVGLSAVMAAAARRGSPGRRASTSRASGCCCAARGRRCSSRGMPSRTHSSRGSFSSGARAASPTTGSSAPTPSTRSAARSRTPRAGRRSSRCSCTEGRARSGRDARVESVAPL